MFGPLCQHLQFFVEVVESSEDLSMSSRFRDVDGLAEEQEERRRKKKWNERFLQFVKEVEDKLTKVRTLSDSTRVYRCYEPLD